MKNYVGDILLFITIMLMVLYSSWDSLFRD